MASQPYRVVLLGTVLPEQSRAQVLTELAKIFHSDTAKMAQLLRGKPVALVKAYARAEAEKICATIRAAGADCRVEKIKSATADARPNAAADAGKTRARPTKTKPKTQSSDAKLMDAVLDFVGVNTEYYQKQFSRFGDPLRPKFRLSWHWPAFFAFFFWAMYRKLWQWAGINLAGSLALMLGNANFILQLAWLLIWPLATNYLYFRHAFTHAKNAYIKPKKPTLQSVRAYNKLHGGVSRLALGGSIIALVLISFALGDFLAPRILARHISADAGAWVQAGARLRGDGGAIDAAVGGQPDAEVAQTLRAFDALLIALRIAAPDAISPEAAFSRLQHTLNRARLQDAWGQPIFVRRDADGQVALRSVGGDGIGDTADDILQYIWFQNLSPPADQ